MNSRLTVKICYAALFGALSVTLQCLPPLFVTPWFMRIDLVAVPWVLCWMLFGLDTALLSLIISIPLVGILGPFAGGWIGAVMKSIASIWMFLIPGLFAIKMGKKRLMNDVLLYMLTCLLAITIRDIICVISNLYFAIPLFFGLSPEEIIAFFSNPRFQSFVSKSIGLIGLMAYILEVSFWNSIQGIVDSYVSLIISLSVQRRLEGMQF